MSKVSERLEKIVMEAKRIAGEIENTESVRYRAIHSSATDLELQLERVKELESSGYFIQDKFRDTSRKDIKTDSGCMYYLDKDFKLDKLPVEVKADELYQPKVRCFIFDEAGENVLISNRLVKTDIKRIVGGTVNVGESYKDAVEREVREEIVMNIKDVKVYDKDDTIKQVFVKSNHPAYDRAITYISSAIYDGDSEQPFLTTEMNIRHLTTTDFHPLHEALLMFEDESSKSIFRAVVRERFNKEIAPKYVSFVGDKLDNLIKSGKSSTVSPMLINALMEISEAEKIGEIQFNKVFVSKDYDEAYADAVSDKDLPNDAFISSPVPGRWINHGYLEVDNGVVKASDSNKFIDNKVSTKDNRFVVLALVYKKDNADKSETSSNLIPLPSISVVKPESMNNNNE